MPSRHTSGRLCALGATTLTLLGGTSASAFAVPLQTETICGEAEESLPELDLDGFIAEPDSSTEEERAADYDDSGEDVEIPEDEGVELTPEEMAALSGCLATSVTDAVADVADSFKGAWDGSRPLLLGTFGPDQLPYGGTVAFRLESGGSSARAARATRSTVLGKSRLVVRSGDTEKLKIRLNGKGRRLLQRKGRVPAVGTLKLTDALSGKSTSKKVRVLLKRKR